MAFDRSHPLFFFFLIFLLFLLTPIMASSAENYEKILSYPFSLDVENPETKTVIFDELFVRNDALVEIYCALYENSSQNITLAMSPEYWNVSSISVGVGEEINVTITNAEEYFSEDVGSYLQLDIIREKPTDEVYGVVVVMVITSGWDNPISWSIISLFAPFFLVIHRLRKRRQSVTP